MTKDDKAFTDKLSQVLDEQVEQLDKDTLSRLRQARLRAVESTERGSFFQYWKPVTVFAMSMILTVSLIMWPQQSDVNDLSSVTDDLDLLVAEDNLQFYDELEFYQWLLVDETEAG
jgi:hypothetical protein